MYVLVALFLLAAVGIAPPAAAASLNPATVEADPGTVSGAVAALFDSDDARVTISEAVVNTSGLVLRYDMETLVGGLMSDLSGNGNDGTITGTTDVAGRFGRARSFDVVGDVISAPDAPSLDLTTVSFGGWIYYDSSNPDAFMAWLRKGFNFELYVRASDDKPYLQWSDGVSRSCVSTIAVSPNAWTHVWGYISPGQQEIWVNGVSGISCAFGGTPSVGALPFTVGLDMGAGTGQDLLDEIRIYSRALSAAEIAQLSLNEFRIRAYVNFTGVAGTSLALDYECQTSLADGDALDLQVARTGSYATVAADICGTVDTIGRYTLDAQRDVIAGTVSFRIADRIGDNQTAESFAVDLFVLAVDSLALPLLFVFWLFLIIIGFVWEPLILLFAGIVGIVLAVIAWAEWAEPMFPFLIAMISIVWFIGGAVGVARSREAE